MVKRKFKFENWELFIIILLIILILDNTYDGFNQINNNQKIENEQIIKNTRNFYISFHNLDLIYNMNGLKSQINELGCYLPDNTTLKITDFLDTGSDFIERPLSDYYISSMNQIDELFISNSIQETSRLNSEIIGNRFILNMIYILFIGMLIGMRIKNGEK